MANGEWRMARYSPFVIHHSPLFQVNWVSIVINQNAFEEFFFQLIGF
jgi:hypothetical protein